MSGYTSTNLRHLPPSSSVYSCRPFYGIFRILQSHRELGVGYYRILQDLVPSESFRGPEQTQAIPSLRRTFHRAAETSTDPLPRMAAKPWSQAWTCCAFFSWSCTELLSPPQRSFLKKLMWILRRVVLPGSHLQAYPGVDDYCRGSGSLLTQMCFRTSLVTSASTCAAAPDSRDSQQTPTNHPSLVWRSAANAPGSRRGRTYQAIFKEASKVPMKEKRSPNCADDDALARGGSCFFCVAFEATSRAMREKWNPHCADDACVRGALRTYKSIISAMGQTARPALAARP